MRPTTATRLYRHDGGALLRAAAVPLTRTPGWWPRVTDAQSCRDWLDEAWALPGFADAVRQASADLADRVEAILHGEVVTVDRVRRATSAIVRYLLRATGRPTPFGMFAGVAPVSIRPVARVRWGDAHRAVARVDTQWLASVIERLEASPHLVERLDVVFNGLAVRRGGRFEAPQGPDRVTVRCTAAVEAVQQAAASPVRFGVLADTVTESFPGADRSTVCAMLVELLRQGFLITCLRAPSTVVDPLGRLLTHLRQAGASALPSVAGLTRDLAAVQRDLRDHNGDALADDERSRLRSLFADRMRRLSTAGRTPLAVDLRLDCDVQIPPAVVAEMERAASALLRLTRQPAGESVWRDFHAAFCDRYGIGVALPVTEVVNPDCGLGYPAGYPGSVLRPPAVGPTERDELLLALAWQAVADGSHEIVLSEDTIQALAGTELDERYISPHVELAARVHAESAAALTRGEFTLTVAPARSAGTLTSRFTLTATGTGLEAVYATAPTAVEGALPVQLSFLPMYSHAENVCRVPAYLPHVLALGEFGHPTPQTVGVEDVAVVADTSRLYLASSSRRRLIEPQVFHALNLQKQPPPLARFLAHLTRAFSASWHEFDWGPYAHRLPYLPRVRYGRAVISPARWRITTRELPADSGTTNEWHTALRRWQQRQNCPDTVELHDADRTLRMTLTEPAHLRHLRARLQRHGEATLTEAAATGEYGWIDGHAHEIAIPLIRTGPAAPPPLIGAWPKTTGGTGTQVPASSQCRWLYAKIYTHPERLDEIIAERLPLLLAALDDEPAYWFVRYRSTHETDHLRLRIQVTDQHVYATCVAALGDWAQRLRDDATIARLVIDTYHPEVGRYGAGPTMDAAEAVFATDSHAVATALRLLPANLVHPVALAAINIMDIVDGFLGGRAEATSWLIDRPITGTGADRALAEQVVRWAIHGTLPNPVTWPAAVTEALRARAAALAVYRQTLDNGNSEIALTSLLHLHHNRAVGIDPGTEATCRRIARQAALAWRSQQRSGQR